MARRLCAALALALVVGLAIGCAGGDAERVAELEQRLAEAEQELEAADAWFDELTEAAARDIARIRELETELERTRRGLGTPPAIEREAVSTLEEVVERGELNCGVKYTQPLFGLLGSDGVPQGFDIEFCKAIAAAVLGDAAAGLYVDASDPFTRFHLLVDGEVDVLIRTTTLTASRDAELGVDFAQVTFYGGQGLAVQADSDYRSTLDMTDNPTICVYEGAATEVNIEAHFEQLGLAYTPLLLTGSEPFEAFVEGRCDVWTADQTVLMSRISTLENAADFRVLGQVISKEPMAPVVRDDDGEWRDIVNWVMHGLIAAEEMGVTSANVSGYAAAPPNWAIARLLGASFQGGEVVDLGFAVDPQFIRRAIQAVGNYGEIYERTIGDVLPRACTLNALAGEDRSDCPPGTGGILYAHPYR